MALYQLKAPLRSPILSNTVRHQLILLFRGTKEGRYGTSTDITAFIFAEKLQAPLSFR